MILRVAPANRNGPGDPWVGSDLEPSRGFRRCCLRGVEAAVRVLGAVLGGCAVPTRVHGEGAGTLAFRGHPDRSSCRLRGQCQLQSATAPSGRSPHLGVGQSLRRVPPPGTRCGRRTRSLRGSGSHPPFGNRGLLVLRTTAQCQDRRNAAQQDALPYAMGHDRSPVSIHWYQPDHAGTFRTGRTAPLWSLRIKIKNQWVVCQRWFASDGPETAPAAAATASGLGTA